MLTQTIANGYHLQQLFKDYGRENHFSFLGFDTLYNYLYELSKDCEKDIHIDVIGLCCDFTEYDSYEELYNNYAYSYNNEEEEWEETNQDQFKEWLQDHTQVIEVTDYDDNVASIIIQNF